MCALCDKANKNANNSKLTRTTLVRDVKFSIISIFQSWPLSASQFQPKPFPCSVVLWDFFFLRIYLHLSISAIQISSQHINSLEPLTDSVDFIVYLFGQTANRIRKNQIKQNIKIFNFWTIRLAAWINYFPLGISMEGPRKTCGLSCASGFGYRYTYEHMCELQTRDLRKHHSVVFWIKTHRQQFIHFHDMIG